MDDRRQKFQIDGPIPYPSTIHRHHRGGVNTRGHKHQAAVRQHRGDNFRLEGDSRDQRQAHGSTYCKILGVQSVGTQQPPRVRYPRQNRMGGATNMGNGNQRRPLQYCIQVQIQSQPCRGFHLWGPPNPCHSRRVARSQERKGARVIGVYSQSGNDKSTKISTAATSATVPFGKLWREG